MTARVIKIVISLPVGGAAERGKPEHLRIVLIRQIVDPAKDRQVGVYFIFRATLRNAQPATRAFRLRVHSAAMRFPPNCLAIENRAESPR